MFLFFRTKILLKLLKQLRLVIFVEHQEVSNKYSKFLDNSVLKDNSS